MGERNVEVRRERASDRIQPPCHKCNQKTWQTGPGVNLRRHMAWQTQQETLILPQR